MPPAGMTSQKTAIGKAQYDPNFSSGQGIIRIVHVKDVRYPFRPRPRRRCSSAAEALEPPSVCRRIVHLIINHIHGYTIDYAVI